MTRLNVFHLSLFLTLLFGTLSSAHATIMEYIPSGKIEIFGVNTAVDMNVKAFFASDPSAIETPPALNTTTRKLSGAFYTKKYAWVEFSTGSYETRISCIQSLAQLTGTCKLTGTGYSPYIGAVGFQDIIYDPSTGKLGGNAHTYFQDFSLTGITLPLRPAHFIGEDGTIFAQLGFSFQIAQAPLYGTGNWKLQLCPPSNPICTTVEAMNPNGIWTVDIPEEGNYSYTITDPQGSITKGIFEVKAGPFDENKTIYSGNLLEGGGVSFLQANGTDLYTLEISFFDKNGNPASLAGMTFYAQLEGENAYVGVAKNQLKNTDIPGISNTTYYYNPAIPDSALRVTSSLPGLVKYTIPLSPGAYTITNNSSNTVTLSFASTAPSETLHWKKLGYTMGNISKDLLSSGIYKDGYLVFKPLVTVSTPAPSPLIEGVLDVRSTVSNTSPGAMDIRTILGFSINTNTPNYYKNFTSGDPVICNQERASVLSPGADECRFTRIGGILNPSIVAVPNTGSFNYTWSGTLSGKTTNYKSIISYMLTDGTGPIVYYGDHWSAIAQAPEPVDPEKLVILGGNGVTIGNTPPLISLLQNIHKEVAEMTRNGFPVNGNNAYIGEESIVVNGGSFSDKKSIISIGGDITITENILNSSNSPWAIIALQDADGNGGKIFIDGSITDIESTLIAEKGVIGIGNTDQQLYVHGSVISRNTLSGSLEDPKRCPFFVQSCDDAEAKRYDLTVLRDTFVSYDAGSLAADPLASSTYSGSSIIIKYDPRIIQDPPPGI